MIEPPSGFKVIDSTPSAARPLAVSVLVLGVVAWALASFLVWLAQTSLITPQFGGLEAGFALPWALLGGAIAIAIPSLIAHWKQEGKAAVFYPGHRFLLASVFNAAVAWLSLVSIASTQGIFEGADPFGRADRFTLLVLPIVVGNNISNLAILLTVREPREERWWTFLCLAKLWTGATQMGLILSRFEHPSRSVGYWPPALQALAFFCVLEIAFVILAMWSDRRRERYRDRLHAVGVVFVAVTNTLILLRLFAS
jgi:hypothetical protein